MLFIKNRFIIVFFSLLIFIHLGLIYQNLSTPKFKDLDSSWGLGTKVTICISNAKDYEWYVDQYFTGRNAELNCGPTVIEMASKWPNKNSTLTTELIKAMCKYQELVFN